MHTVNRQETGTMSWMFRGLFGRKSYARITLNGIRKENNYFLLNLVQTWNLPGRLSTLPGKMVRIELEGREKTLRARIKELQDHPTIGFSTMDVVWLPYTGRFPNFSMLFSNQ